MVGDIQRMDSMLRAIEMYNIICGVEQEINDGVHIEGLDIDLLKQTKEDCLDIIYQRPRRFQGVSYSDHTTLVKS